MKDTVEVRLLVPKELHEKIVALARKNMRTTQKQYIYMLAYIMGEAVDNG